MLFHRTVLFHLHRIVYLQLHHLAAMLHHTVHRMVYHHMGYHHHHVVYHHRHHYHKFLPRNKCNLTTIHWFRFDVFFDVLGVREKDVLCDVCGAAFASVPLMKNHRLHHNEAYRNRVQCPHCTFTTYKKSICKNHMKTHHGSLPQHDHLIVVRDVRPIPPVIPPHAPIQQAAPTSQPAPAPPVPAPLPAALPPALPPPPPVQVRCSLLYFCSEKPTISEYFK